MYIWSLKIIVSSFFWIMSVFGHPHYVSVTELEYVSEKKELQIACKWFVDDFEETLRYSSGLKYDLSSSYKEIGHDTIIQSYINDHIRIRIDGKQNELMYVGAELEKGAVWTYWVVKDISSFKIVQLYNNMFCEKHADQIHLVHFTFDKKRSSRKLTCKEALTTFQ